jgi:hypothetical protein
MQGGVHRPEYVERALRAITAKTAHWAVECAAFAAHPTEWVTLAGHLQVY